MYLALASSPDTRNFIWGNICLRGERRKQSCRINLTLLHNQQPWAVYKKTIQGKLWQLFSSCALFAGKLFPRPDLLLAPDNDRACYLHFECIVHLCVCLSACPVLQSSLTLCQLSSCCFSAHIYHIYEWRQATSDQSPCSSSSVVAGQPLTRNFRYQ